MKKKVFTLITAMVLGCGGLIAQNDYASRDTLVATSEGLIKALNDGFGTINLPEGCVFTLDSQLVINRPVKIIGAEGGYPPRIEAKKDAWTGDDSKRNLISIESSSEEGEVLIQNLSVWESLASGINVRTNMDVTLKYVSSVKNEKAGFQIQSKVTARGLRTQENKLGGVNLDNGDSGYVPELTLLDCNFYEAVEIWSDDATDASKNYLVVPEEDTELGNIVKTYKNNVFVWNKDKGSQRFWFRENYTISSVDELRMAVNVGVDTVNLYSGNYELDEQLVITNPITIKSDYTIKPVISPSENWKGGETNLISIEGNGNSGYVILNGLIIEGSKASGVNVQTSRPVKLEDCILRNNANAGLLVYCEVNAYGVKTQGNGLGGVKVGYSTPQYGIPSFLFDKYCEFFENTKIWSEKTDDSVEVLPKDESKWSSFIQDGKCYWVPSSTENMINIAYGAMQNGTVNIVYNDKPAASYASVPSSVRSIKLVAVPDKGYKLSDKSLKVNSEEIAADGIYSFLDASAIKIEAKFKKNEEEMKVAVDEVNNAESVVVSEDKIEEVEVNKPIIVGEFVDNNVKTISSPVETEEAANIVNAYNENSTDNVEYDELVAFDVTPMRVVNENEDEVVSESIVSSEEEVAVAFAYPAGISSSEVTNATALHMKDNGEIELLNAKAKDKYIYVRGIKSFSKIVLAIATENTTPVVTYHNLNIIKSEGAKLTSRYNKMKTSNGGSFTLSLEMEEGYENCAPIVYVKRGRYGEWMEHKIDEVSGFYQIRNVYTDIYVKVSGDGIWPVSNEEMDAQEVKVYTQNGAIVIVTPSLMDVQVITMNGLKVASDKVAGQRKFYNLLEGIYVVKVGKEVFKVKL